VIVDIRPSSPTYGKSVVVELTGALGNAVLIGEGLGHGFLSLEDNSIVAYLVSSPYSPMDEFEINPLDSRLEIDWGMPVSELLLSTKDRAAPSLYERAMQGKLPK
jgi:dTDP-4-dehydrorhamnose 3,5-epimerase